MFYLEIDQLIDLIERPIFRHLHLRLLECEDDPYNEGSGAMLFLTLKRVMMLLPQSTSYMILQERLLSVARYRQSAMALNAVSKHVEIGSETDVFVKRVLIARRIHVWAKWRMIRAESLQEEPCRIVTDEQKFNAQQQRREWLGYADEEDEKAARQKIKNNQLGTATEKAELVGVYEGLDEIERTPAAKYDDNEECEACVQARSSKEVPNQFHRKSSSDIETKTQWREFWVNRS